MSNFEKVCLILVLLAALNDAKTIITIDESELEALENGIKSETTLYLDLVKSVGDYRKYVGGQREQGTSAFLNSFKPFLDDTVISLKSGDGVVAQTSKNQRYKTAQNVKVDLRYPASGFGKLVTYVEITVNQTSTQGSAIISSGGFGQHFIGLTIYAQNTYQMDYSAVVYGM